MSDATALERARLTVRGDRAELRIEDGRITITKEAPTRATPTTVVVDVDQVRGTQMQAPTRRSRGWLHLSVVDGSPAPPGELAAAGDPYTLPLTSRSVSAAKRLDKLVERHIRERGLPRDAGPNEGRLSSGVSLTSAPATAQRTTPPPPPPPSAAPQELTPADLVAELRSLAELHDAGALTDEEFERAKARILG